MTKQDFVLIANTLNVAVRKFADMPADMEVMEVVCQRLVIAMRQHNRKFDEKKFRELMFNLNN